MVGYFVLLKMNVNKNPDNCCQGATQGVRGCGT